MARGRQGARPIWSLWAWVGLATKATRLRNFGSIERAMTLILTVESGGADEGPISPYPVEGDLIIAGRSRNCDWHLPDPTNAISSRHCEIRRDGDAWILTDISTNGTFLN